MGAIPVMLSSNLLVFEQTILLEHSSKEPLYHTNNAKTVPKIFFFEINL